MTQINSHSQGGMTVTQIIVRVFITSILLIIGIPFFSPGSFVLMRKRIKVSVPPT
jgi:competence protein ComGC